MNAPLRRNQCPTLADPIQTGDGLLARLNPVAAGLTRQSLVGIGEAALRHGNGLIEVTARGSLQIRGLTPRSSALLAAEVGALGIEVREGVPVDISPLAGLDAAERTDPEPVAQAIRSAIAAAGLSARLGPKVSVVVDALGAIDLSDMLADIRLTAVADGWLLAIAGDGRSARVLGWAKANDAVIAAVSLLETIASRGRQARARDLSADELPAMLRPCATADLPTPDRAELSRTILALGSGQFAARTALPFGKVHARDLIGFISDVDATDVRLAPHHSLLLLCGARACADAALAVARKHGFVVDADDPRRAVSACAGAPSCASAYIPARQIGALVAGRLPGSIHVSGCAKGCAHPSPADFVLTGTATGLAIIRNGRAGDAPQAVVGGLEAALSRLQGQAA